MSRSDLTCVPAGYSVFTASRPLGRLCAVSDASLRLAPFIARQGAPSVPIVLRIVLCSCPISLCLTIPCKPSGGGNRPIRGRFSASPGEEIGRAGEEIGQQSTGRACACRQSAGRLRGRKSANLPGLVPGRRVSGVVPIRFRGRFPAKPHFPSTRSTFYGVCGGGIRPSW